MWNLTKMYLYSFSPQILLKRCFSGLEEIQWGRHYCCSNEEATVRAVKMFWSSSELLSVLSGSRAEIPCSWQQPIKPIIKSHISSVSPDHFRNRRHLDSNLISDLSNYTLRQLIFCPAANAIIASIQLLFPLLMNLIRTEFQLFARSEHPPSLISTLPYRFS